MRIEQLNSLFEVSIFFNLGYAAIKEFRGLYFSRLFVPIQELENKLNYISRITFMVGSNPVVGDTIREKITRLFRCHDELDEMHKKAVSLFQEAHERFAKKHTVFARASYSIGLLSVLLLGVSSIFLSKEVDPWIYYSIGFYLLCSIGYVPLAHMYLRNSSAGMIKQGKIMAICEMGHDKYSKLAEDVEVIITHYRNGAGIQREAMKDLQDTESKLSEDG